MIWWRNWKVDHNSAVKASRLALGKVDPRFSVGSFEALRSVRVQAMLSPGLAPQELSALIRKVDPDSGGLDFEAAFELDELIPEDIPNHIPHEFYRACIFQILVRIDPRWGRVITLGRERFVYMLDRDEQQCFRAARLMEDPPDDDVVDWWDSLSGHMRRQTEAQKQERGRQAEKLTISHETKKLNALGLALTPRWVAIEDNTAGYDVLSFEPGEVAPVNRLIEVKSSVASPLRFYVTRNEWSKAVEFGDAYLFHVWDMTADPPRLHTRTVEQVTPHIPIDQQKGVWATAVIPLAAQ